MAANKFATMLHRNTNKITLILFYVILEWILIVLLLLNSLFSYLIVKFADYFGLKRPCLWCSRLDHIFEPQKNKNLRRDLVCESHASEISKLGYCSNHRKLAESQDMCEDCSSSSRPNCQETTKIAFFRWVKEIGMIQSDSEKRIENGGEVNMRCSCCDVSLNSKFCSPYLLIKPSWGVLDYTQKGNLIVEAGDGDEIEESDDLGRNGSDWVIDRCIDEHGIEKNAEEEDGVAENQMLSDVDGAVVFNELEVDEEDKKGMVVEAEQEPIKEEDDLITFMEDPSSDKNMIQVNCIEDASLEILSRTVENCADHVDHRLIPVELIDLTTAENQSGFKVEEEDQVNCDNQEASLSSELHVETPVELVVENRCTERETMAVVAVHKIKEETKFALPESMEIGENENSSTLHAEEGDSVSENDQATTATAAVESASDVHSVSEEVFHTHSDETESEILIRKEMPDQEQTDEVRIPEILATHPCKLEDPSTSSPNFLADDDHGSKQAEEEIIECKTIVVETMAVVSVHESKEGEPMIASPETMEIEENGNSSTLHAEEGDSVSEVYEPVAITQATQILSSIDDDDQATAAVKRDSEIHSASEEVFHTLSNKTEAEILKEIEMPDEEKPNEVQTQEILATHPCGVEDPSTSSSNLLPVDDHGSKQAEERIIECKTMPVEMSEQTINNHLSLCSELNEIEEDKVPDTPTSIEGLHHLDKNLLLLEKRELGAEESLDGSVISEFESGEGVQTVERLKSALRTERKALNALYAELEEERSASAVAASQTMAMINRLQEEKAAMQMEALQYQRMMEEQTEYDQEALQLLNELMVKREKEKQELEKELEIYRKKVMDYEAREKMMMLRRRKESSARSGTSSASCSNAEDSDGLSIDLNHEGKEDDSSNGNQESGNHNTPVDEVLNLEESLAHFEEERLSILDQLKVLEEKLFTFGDEEQHFENMKPFELFYEENGKDFHGDSDFTNEENGVLQNGFSKEMNGKHQERTIMGSKPKRLLPLFDAIDTETEDGALNGHENGFDSVVSQNPSVAKSELDSKKLAIEEEVDHVYERLQALEADREFLKHCFSSLKKGDKGIELLQEILQHLRDLRDVELRVRNMGDVVLL